MTKQMTPNQYESLALRTNGTKVIPGLGAKLSQLDHAADGFCTEAGEFKDGIKKYKNYGRPLDEINLREEIGDLLWYIALACDALDTTIEAEMIRNIEKLRTRYPDSFANELAISRNLKAERVTLEAK